MCILYSILCDILYYIVACILYYTVMLYSVKHVMCCIIMYMYMYTSDSSFVRLQGSVECEGPNPFMYEFTGNLLLDGQR